MAFVGMIMGALQTEILPTYLGFDHPWTWLIALAAGVALGAVVGGFQGWITAYLNVPAFIVTLGGLLVWRGAAWWVASGKTLAPMDTTFQIIGGGASGTIGATASWIVAVIACIGILAAIVNGRRQRQKFSFPLRPIWAEVTIAIIGCAVVLIAVGVLNAYPLPIGLAKLYAAKYNIPFPEDGSLFVSFGIAVPVLIALGAAVLVTFLGTRTRFGRYVFAIGGNPEAARLAGNQRAVGYGQGVHADGRPHRPSPRAISIARLNASTNALGTSYELYTIAATVIGGTSLAGGVGTVAGALLGAVVMQSLQSGMVAARLRRAPAEHRYRRRAGLRGVDRLRSNRKRAT